MQVTAGPVKEDQRGTAGVTGVQIAGAHSPGVEVTLRKRDTLEIAPYALELRHGSSLPIAGEIWFSFRAYLVC